MDDSNVLTPSEIRLDVWLDVACLFRTRSEAQKACKNGKVDVNGQTAKPHRTVRVGDEIEVGARLEEHRRSSFVVWLIEILPEPTHDSCTKT